MKSLMLKSRHLIVNKEGKIVFGNGRREIFENIEQTGSMYQTARNMAMSYKAVWSKVKATENAVGVILVERDGTRGSRLTKEGRALLDAYNRFHKKTLQSEDKYFQSIFKQGDSRVKRPSRSKETQS